MKLLEKNTRFLLKVLPLVLLICTILFFILLEFQTHHLQEVQLLLKQENVLRKFDKDELGPKMSIVGEYEISSGKYIPPAAFKGPIDTLIYYPSRKEYVPFEMMATDVSRNGTNFQLTTFVSSVEISHLKVAVFGSQFLIYLVLFMAIFRINTWLSNVLWKPFNKTMARLKRYDINTHDSLSLHDQTDIEEFNQLNHVIEELTERNHQAFVNQKQFVENASHEIQTPLAIIRSKVDLLMEQPDITPNSASLILDIADANNRLSNLNSTLILLSKIQNQQFIKNEDLDFGQLVSRIVKSYGDFYIDQMPALTLQLDEHVTRGMNPDLAEILVGNLVKNAIVHNIPGGFLRIVLTPDNLQMENSGKALDGEPSRMFDRFQTAANDKKSTGLGLSLVKQICDLYGDILTYTYKENTHILTIDFSSRGES